MTVASPIENPPAETYAIAPLGGMMGQQIKTELLKLWRVPAFSVTSVIFPIMFFTFFGLPNLNGTLNGIRAGTFLLASYAAYGAISVALFSFGVGVAVERGERQTVLMRATPLRPIAYLIGKVVAAIVFALVMLILLFAFGALVGKIRLDAGTWVGLTLRLLAGLLPFVALGSAVGFIASPNSAAPIINLVYLPLSFASGLFIPPSQLPTLLQNIAPYTPTYHYAQLAWSGLGANTESLATSIFWLTGYGAVFTAVAIWGYAREQTRTFS